MKFLYAINCTSLAVVLAQTSPYLQMEVRPFPLMLAGDMALTGLSPHHRDPYPTQAESFCAVKLALKLGAGWNRGPKDLAIPR